MLEGLSAVRARITELRQRFGITDEPAGPQPVSTAGLASSVAALAPAEVGGFDGELRLALRRREPAAGPSPEVEEAIHTASSRYGLGADLLRAVVRQESGFNPRAVSPAGAMGLMQLMPDTARALGVADPFDPAQNVDGGARYLRQQLERFGSLPLALAAYNAGPGAVERHGGVPPFRETESYVDSILGALRSSQ